jgi:hypothetical protein
VLATPCFVLAAGRVELELANDPNNSGVNAQQWFQALTSLKVGGLRIRALSPQDEPKLEIGGTGASPVYRLKGILTARNELILPGASFTLRDQRALAAWLKKLAEEGPNDPNRAKMPFNLSEEELFRVKQDLSPAVADSTKGTDRRQTFATLRSKLNLAAGPGLDAALAAAGPVDDELKGLATGTALATVLRPAGWALAPRKGARGEIEYRVFSPAAAEEMWPVGFSAEDRRQKLLPTLLQVISVEIDAISLAEALSAIAGRLEVPVLYDHNALAAQRIDVATAQVSIPSRKLSYSSILRMLVGQVKLEYELRVDEADRPFLWVTSFRK